MMGPQIEFIGDTQALFEDQLWTFFAGNDYHRFSRHPEVVAALIEATHRHGINSGGSRITTANHALYLQLEEALASFLGVDAAHVCSAGYLSSTMLLQGIARDFDSIFIDSVAHGSLMDAALQSGLPITAFQHRDPEDLACRLTESTNRAARPLLLTDGVFASTGDIAPLMAYATLLSPLGGRILVDDAHGVGTLGTAGRGTHDELGVARDVIYQAGTLSKGLGGFGGFIAGARSDIDSIRSLSRSFKGSTPMPLPIAAASIRAIEILGREPERITRLRYLAETVKPRLRDLGFRISEGVAPICSVTFLDADKNRLLGASLREHGILPSFIDYPGSPPGGHYRFTLSSAHTDSQIESLCNAVALAVRRCQ